MGRRRLTHNELIDQFREIHGEKYDYSKVEYVNDRTKVVIICPDHGEFAQRPTDHKQGRGCRWCSIQLLPRDSIIKRFREIHGEKYDYSDFDYAGAYVKSNIICPIHGKFSQSAHHHTRGNSCPKCFHERVKGGYDSLSPEQRTKIKDVYLYHLELQYEDTIFHKIGITGDPPSRFSVIQNQSKSEIINGWIHMYGNAEIAYTKEQKILDHMMFERSEKYLHPIKFKGVNECFLPVPNPQGWNLDLNNIPKKSQRFNYYSEI